MNFSSGIYCSLYHEGELTLSQVWPFYVTLYSNGHPWDEDLRKELHWRLPTVQNVPLSGRKSPLPLSISVGGGSVQVTLYSNGQ